MAERRRVRVVLEYEVEIHDMSMAAIRQRDDEWRREQIESGHFHGLYPERPTESELADLRLLQEAVRANPEVLDEWLEFEATAMLDSYDIRAPGSVELVEDEGAVLLPAVETLPPAPRHKFREAIARDTFWEMADEFYRSFDFRLAEVKIRARA